jgi:hypothetical protein
MTMGEWGNMSDLERTQWARRNVRMPEGDVLTIIELASGTAKRRHYDDQVLCEMKIGHHKDTLTSAEMPQPQTASEARSL